MRHIKARIKKKRKPLKLFTNTKLLHSKTGKSTYFYKQQWFSTYSIPLASTLGLLLVLGLCINPFSPSSNSDKAYAAGTATAGTVSLTMNGSTDLSRNLTSGNTGYVSSTFKVEAGTGLSQYQVVVQAANGYSSSLVGAATKTTINGISGSVKGNALANNTWGYALQKDATYTSDTDLANMTYQALPGSGSTTAAQTVTLNNAAATHNYTLAFAANIKDKTADHYQTSVLLSVAAGVEEVTGEFLGFNNITYMQDMNAAVCYHASVGETKQLIDRRDSNKYWVSKLKDGNCWMTQNLNYNGGGTSNTLENWSKDNTVAQYHDPGAYIVKNPVSWSDCSNGTEGIGFANCDMLTNVSSMTASTDPNFYIKNNATTNDNTYDAHYLVGNYYSWRAALNGSEKALTALDGEDVEESVCPTGWQLPTSGSSGGQFASLSNGLVGGISSKQNVKLPPYYFAGGGEIVLNKLYHFPSDAFYWSATSGATKSSKYAYHMVIESSIDANSRYGDMYAGYNVRCIAK